MSRRSHTFRDSTLLEKLVVVARNRESPEVPKSRVNPDHWFLGTHVSILSSIQPSRGLRVKFVLVQKVPKSQSPESILAIR
jgi:hypothetical protein